MAAIFVPGIGIVRAEVPEFSKMASISVPIRFGISAACVICHWPRAVARVTFSDDTLATSKPACAKIDQGQSLDRLANLVAATI